MSQNNQKKPNPPSSGNNKSQFQRYLPLIIAAVIAILRYLPLMNDISGVVAGDVPLPSTRTTLIILGIGAVLTLPLLPIRSMVTAAYVRGLRS